MLRVLFIIAFVTLIITILSSIFYSLHTFFEPQKRFHKFGIVGKPRPNGKYLGKKIEKKKKKKNEDENFQLFIQNSYNLQNLITKTIVLSANENIFGGKFLNIKLNTH